MKFFAFVLFAVSLATAAVLPESETPAKVSYDGYKLFHVEASDGLSNLNSQTSGLTDTISLHGCTHDDHLDYAVPRHELEAFQALNLNATVVHDDLGAAIAAEGPLVPFEAPNTLAAAALPSAIWFDAYHSFADHISWLSAVQAAFPNNSEVFVAGQSYEGRNITGIHLWGSGGKDSKPVIYYHGTVHAREWVATMVAEYIVYSLVSNYTTDISVKSYLDNFDFYVIPVVNPDGFAYSQSTQRLWRKNRQVRPSTSSVGTDINRNWPYKWDVSGGASTSPSAEDYKGQAACDTPECKVLTAHATKIAAAHGIKWYIDFHSYAEAILLPYGYSCSATVPNLAEQQSLANGMKSTIASAYGTQFIAGPICTTLYQATGGSTDYLTKTIGVEFAWAIELRGTSFVLPANQILPSGIEIWNGVKEVLGQLS